ncbi:MAG: monofunctional biosynthetic peptidoglycan transglycosylase [Pseudomonadota bacterium]
MAKKSRATKKTTKKPGRLVRVSTFLRRWAWRGVAIAAMLVLFVVLLWSLVNPPTTFYMSQESRRLGGVDQYWVSLEDIAPVMARSVVAAEDANYCLHWGFDVEAIRTAIEDGGGRGASTLTQQVVKNVYLWHGRSWFRKALEAGLTPLVEAVWSKRRILEVYLNIAEFDEGVFGIEAASRHYFKVGPEDLSATQAARLAAVLPSPKTRSAAKPTAQLRRRAASIADGAATIRKDGRAACFED